jgi:hypothetical protein
MKIYLDVCCLNRPFDDPSQMRVHLEAEAVLVIIKQVEQAEWTWVSSDAVVYEISKTPNEDRRERLWSLEAGQGEFVLPINPQQIKRLIIFLDIHAQLAYKA